MRSYYLSFLRAGVLPQGSLAQTSETAPAKIKRAQSAAPRDIAKAKVVDMDDKGNITVLREGSNSFTCFQGHSSGSTTRCPINRGQRTRNPGLLTCWPDWSGGGSDPTATSGSPIKGPLRSF
jgi:hypothetical protein